MDKISLAIVSVTLSLIIVWLSITITMTNVFGNNKPLVTSYNKLPILGNNSKSKCVGIDDSKYKLYNTIKINGYIIEECEGVISESKNTKMVLQSDGRVVIYDKNKGNVKSSVYPLGGSNPFFLVETGKVIYKKFGVDTFLKDVFTNLRGNRIKINDNYTFTKVYNALPTVDFKGKGENTPRTGDVTILNKNLQIKISYAVVDTNNVLKSILVLIDPLEVMKFCVTSVLNLLDIRLEKSIKLWFQNSTDEILFFGAIDGIIINTNYLQKQLEKDDGDIAMFKITLINSIIYGITIFVLSDLKVSRDFVFMCYRYITFRTGFHTDLRIEQKDDPQKINPWDNGYFLLNTELKYPGFIRGMINGFTASQDWNVISKSITRFTLDELWTTYQNQLELNPTTKPLYMYVPDIITT